MDGWTPKWLVDKWMNKWMDGQMDQIFHSSIYGWTKRQIKQTNR